MALSRYTATIVFQFTPLREGRQISITPNKSIEDFNSRPSARGDANIVRNIPTKEIFQFTPLREGRPCPRPASPPRQISIHAPPRGATHMARICRIPSSFQFTPLREGRRILFPPTVLFSNFNSRPSARGDQQIKRITIFQHYFNSRPSARGDTRNRRHCWQWQRFQFTPLREGRRAAAAQSSAAINISIHAPPRGATSDAGRSLQSSNISIHAPPRGATITCERRYPISNISIHAPPRGATLYGTQFEELHVHFNSRPSARGDTRRARLSGQRRGYFNSRPSARGDG